MPEKPKTKLTGEDRETFTEDMSRKSRWFRETRGDFSDDQFQELLDGALEHVARAREARGVLRDPGRGRIKAEISVLGGRRRVQAKKLDRPPKEGDSEHFATNAFELVGPEKFFQTQIKIRPKRGAKTRLDLSTARVFLYDPKMRQWNLIENSGYNARANYIFSDAYREGTYAAIALPRDREKLRDLALMRFAYLNMQLGLDTGMIGSAEEYFEARNFRKLATKTRDPEANAKEQKRQIADNVKIHRETLKFKKAWPSQLPNNGKPEWHLIEALEDLAPEKLEVLKILDILEYFPFIKRLTNRVGRWYTQGPTNINGRIKSIAAHPTSSNILYAGAANGGIWKTSNGGASWSYKWKFEDTMAIGSLAIARTATGTLYAGTGEYTPGYGPSYGGKGIYKTTNSGDDWTIVASNSEVGGLCSKIEVHPNNANIVYAATNLGVYKTGNGGIDWDRVLNEGGASDLVIDTANPDTVYAGIHNKGIYKTTNGGTSWDRLDGKRVFSLATLILGVLSPMPVDGDAGWLKLAIGKEGEYGTEFLVAKFGQKGEKLYATGNGGDVWYPMPSTHPVRYNEWCTLVAVHPKDPKTIFAGGVGMARATDGYNFANTSGTHSDHHMIAFDPNNNNVCWAATDGGVYRSTNKGATWQLRSSYLTATQLMSLGVAQTGSFLAGSATQDQGIVQTEGSFQWDDWGGGNEWGMFVVDPNNRNNIYISPGSKFLRRSTDAGRNYTTLSGGLTDYWPSQDKQTRRAVFQHVAVKPGNSNIIVGVAVVSDKVKDANDVVTDSYGPKERIYYTCDKGGSWSVALNFPGGTAGNRVGFAPNNANRVYVGTRNGHVYRSNNAGQSGWSKPYASANKPPNGAITSVTVDPLDANTVYITYGNTQGVWRSTNAGATWENVSGTPSALTLPTISCNDLVVDHENSDVLYVATDIGVYRSNDAGYSWYFYNDSIGEYDLPKVLVTSLEQHRSSNRLFASTMGRGLYYTYTSGIHSLRITEICKTFRGHTFQGIQFVKATDGSTTTIMTRNEVIRRIEAGSNFFTIGSDGSRAEVLAMRPDGTHPLDYIKTTPDKTLADNLLSLPRFNHW